MLTSWLDRARRRLTPARPAAPAPRQAEDPGDSGKIRLLLTGSAPKMARAAADSVDRDRIAVRIGPVQSPDVDWADVVLPLTLSDQLMMSAFFPEQLARKFLAPSVEALRICADKALFAAFMAENGFDAYLPPPIDARTRTAIIKPRFSAGGRGVRLTTGAEAMGVAAETHVGQTWIDTGTEYTANIIFDGTIRFLRGVEYSKPSSPHIKRKPEDTPHDFKAVPQPIVEVFTRILTRLGYQGICCFDYLIVDARPVILELNPRICGSLFNFRREELIDAYCSTVLGPEKPQPFGQQA